MTMVFDQNQMVNKSIYDVTEYLPSFRKLLTLDMMIWKSLKWCKGYYNFQTMIVLKSSINSNSPARKIIIEMLWGCKYDVMLNVHIF